ncbi:hypothetical protein HBI25_193980 [Parastagonospora nodorum]|nr:hypothetical protein HBH69_165900 [Parastagonospora nodorum]KAH5549527.1 hypothetical protein HBI25_193980 [Parastagonospora nodorum]
MRLVAARNRTASFRSDFDRSVAGNRRQVGATLLKLPNSTRTVTLHCGHGFRYCDRLHAPSARDRCWFAAIRQQTQIASLTADGSPVMEESESWDPKALHTTCIRHILNCRADAIKLRPANGSTASDSAPVTRACVTLEQRFL